MAFKVVVPAVGESVQEGMIHKWHKQDGDSVAVDDVLLELETDKATVEIVAEHAGVIRLTRKQGETVRVGDELATIDPDAAAASAAPASATKASQQAPAAGASPEPTHSAPPPPPPPPASQPKGGQTHGSPNLSPAVQRIVAETGVNPTQITGTGRDGRLTKGDVIEHLNNKQNSNDVAPTASASASKQVSAGSRAVIREPMSMLRRRIAQRLLEAQTTNAILTTFNEVDMSATMKLRSTYKDRFKEKYGVNLGFMSFFVKAAIDALKAFPLVNGHIDGNDIVKYGYYDIGVAISTDRGLMVPVIRDADSLDFAGIESAIVKYAEKARAGKITVEDLSGGTFTVTNGGVFGSLVSTPIINPPQSAILGMHKIQERPIAVNGEVVIRPMMYLALSYDHRIVDGKEAVGFLVKIKEAIEDPSRLLLGL